MQAGRKARIGYCSSVPVLLPLLLPLLLLLLPLVTARLVGSNHTDCAQREMERGRGGIERKLEM